MKRHAILIGDAGANHELTGVHLDLDNYATFLKSLRGGAWNNDEITLLKDRSSECFSNEIMKIKKNLFDVVFCVFTGHGRFSSKYNCRMIQIGGHEIKETVLWNLAPKQITIFDSCSGIELTESSLMNEYSFNEKNNINARKEYEKICNECDNQQIRLYASEKGLYANDTQDGGLYSKTLLDILRNEAISGQYMSIKEAHEKAYNDVIITSDIIRLSQENSTNCIQIPEFKIEPDRDKILPGAIKGDVL